LNLALALSELAPTGLLDADVHGPDIPRMVNLKRDLSVRHWDLWRAKPLEIEPLERFGIKILSAGFFLGENDPLAWQASLVRRMLWQLLWDARWGELEYLIVDLPPGTADLHQEMLGFGVFSGALLVVTPQDVAHLDAKRSVELYRRSGIRILGGVENMSGLVCPHCSELIELFPPVRADRSIWAIEVEKLAEIPMTPAIGVADEEGSPLIVTAPESEPARAFRQLAWHLRDRLEDKGDA
jgi:ATP-binding protein involved in chromosome partitioning